LNILFLLLPAIGWGILPLIVKKIDSKIGNQILGTGIGALFVGLIMQFIFSPNGVSVSVFLISMASGILWTIGQTGQYKSLELMGVTKTMPITTGLQLVGTSLISLFAFGEWPTLLNKIVGTGAVILIIIGAVLTSISDEKGQYDQFKKGLSILIFTSVGYWGYSIVPKLVDVSGVSIFFPQMLGVFTAALIYVACTSPAVIKEKSTWALSISGMIFSVAAFCYIISAQNIGIATSYIFSQLNVVIATVGGIFILKEKKTKMELKFIVVGLILIVSGSVITSFS